MGEDRRVCISPDLEILMNYVASGVEPRNIKLKDNFYDEYSKIAKEEIAVTINPL